MKRFVFGYLAGWLSAIVLGGLLIATDDAFNDYPPYN